MSHPNKVKNKYNIIAWVLLFVGIVFGVDGLLQLMENNGDRLGEASFGGLLAVISSVFFLLGSHEAKLTVAEAIE